MKKLTYKSQKKYSIMRNLFIVTIISLGTVFSTFSQENSAKKTISKNYKASKNTFLIISNKYGKVDVNTWNQNKITVDIEMKAWAGNESKAQRLLKDIEVNISEHNDEIEFNTHINSHNVRISRNSGFEINYRVNIPTDIALELSNKYGPVYLGDFAGKLTLYVGYDKLKAGKITGKRTDITVKYGRADIDEIVQGELTFKYCKDVTIRKVGNVELENKYGSIEIREAQNIRGHIGYSQLEIDNLTKNLRLTSSYSGTKIRNVAKGFENIDVEAKYGGTVLSFARDVSFEFAIKAKYGGFDNDLDNVNFKKQIKYNTSSEYSGTYGTGKNFGKIYITSGYGNINFR